LKSEFKKYIALLSSLEHSFAK